ncbi:putative NBD/HSP70 family sugar kinase [Motilibacter rhizosphaerae]|uniref:Putative NBD/HSP70 family sugar kinase n=1 Tax=Motilibacter rhizosphaerae TaxID=598652 RepID=A0A4Q7N773_9ACTN|nr:ROK family transcriptional regulator [Motilibacter rhizosphaerae]RZS77531.1 putative NBD/HSP70 family sugar kinase [Motilibacter rhizosphaerae]
MAVRRESDVLRGADRAVVEVLRRHPGSTRAELARRTRLPLSTVSGAVSRLVAAGIVGDEQSATTGAAGRRGRPASVLSLRPQDRTIGVVEVTHHAGGLARAALISAGGSVLARVDAPFRLLDCADIAADCARLLGAASAAVGGRAFDHVVVALPLAYEQGVGIAPLEPGRLAAGGPVPPRLGWLFSDVAARLEDALGVPATVDNDGNVAALGEHAFGAGRGHDDLIHLKLVTGLAAGLVVDGRLVRGARGLAGELSHLRIDSAGPACACGRRGCLGKIATADHLLEPHRARLAPRASVYDVLALAAQGDPEVRDVLGALGRLVGRYLAPVCVMLNPSIIVVDGTLGPAAAPVIDGMVQSLESALPTGTQRAMTVVLGQLGDQAALLGAPRLALDPA